MVPPTPPPTDHDAVGIYGKIPAQGDFVRVNASDALAQGLDQWIQEGLEALSRVNAALPSETTYFVFRVGAQGLVGALTASADRVGRVYPLVVFARLDATLLAQRVSAAPTAYGVFLQDAVELLAEAPRVNAAALAARARTLRVPSVSDLAQADAVCRHTLDRTTAGALSRRVFGDTADARHYFAFKTFLDACDTARGRPGGAASRAAITLDCPIRCDIDLFTWLELARRRLYGSAVSPAFVWCEGQNPRLLLALGPAPAALLRYVARPADAASQLWPLTTTHAETLDQARQSFPVPYRRALDSADAPLEALVNALSR